MAVSNIFTPSTIIVSAEVNTNFTETDYTDIDNNRTIQWRNAAGALSAYIRQDSSNNITIFNPDGNVHLYNSGGTIHLRIYGTAGGAVYGDHWFDGTDYNVGTGSGDLRLEPNTDKVGINIAPLDTLHVYKSNTDTDDYSGITIEQASTGDATTTYLLSGARKWLTGIDNSDFDKFKISEATADGLYDDTFAIDVSGNVNIGGGTSVDKISIYQNTATTDQFSGITIEQDGTGDVTATFLLSGTRKWLVGIDNSDGDSFKISEATADGLYDNTFIINTSGQVNIGGNTVISGYLYSGTHFSDNGSNSQVLSFKQYGWGFITAGAGVTYVSESITLPLNYSSPKFSVQAQCAFSKSGSDPVTPIDVTGPAGTDVYTTAGPNGPASFTVYIVNKNGSVLSSGMRYIYTWESVGPL